MSISRLGALYDVRDERAGVNVELPLLSVSQVHGVVPRNALMGDDGRASNLENYNVCRKGDVVINRMSAYHGAVGVAWQDGVVSPDYLVITPRTAGDARFITYWLKSHWGQYEVVSRLRGIGSPDALQVRTPRLNETDLRRIPGPFPGSSTQRAIADYLERETEQIDALITEQRGLIETLRERRSSIIEKAVTQGIADAQLGECPVPWAPQVPNHWQIARMKYDTVMRAGGTPDTDEKEFWAEPGQPESTPWVAISDMSQRDTVECTAKALTPEGIASKRLSVGSPGTILLAMYASVGEVSRLHIEASWNQAILGITPGDRLDSGYLAYSLQAMRRFMLSVVRTNTQANLNAGQVGDMWLPCPPLNEQKQIASYIDDELRRADALVAESEDLIALSQERRAALITAAVTGQVDVRAAA